jgi:hypothetical protein
MDAQRQAQVAFYFTGKRPGDALEPVAGLDLRPALLARYRRLSALRYDYPLVLLGHTVDDTAGEACVRPLSALVDAALVNIANGDDGDRVSHHVLGLEQRIREIAGISPDTSLAGLWQQAAEQIGIGEDETVRDSLARAFAAIKADGDVADCDVRLPSRLLSHVWAVTQRHKADHLQNAIARLVHSVSNILRADFARSALGRSADSLKASIGGVDADGIDFDAMSRVLARTANRSTISATRRQRLEQLIAALQSYDFSPDAFRFSSCASALEAWRERYPVLVGVARAIAMAELEIAGDYRDERHDAFFDDYGSDGLAPDDIALFADYLVCVNADTLDATEQAALMEILSSGLPMKILVQTDDLLEDSLPGSGRSGFGRSAPHFANMALGLNEVFVLQAAASHLPRCSRLIQRGIAYAGASLFSVFSGATEFAGDLPAYLVAAAAVESRAFPLFAYDPAAGHDWASRFSLMFNPQPDIDWPVHTLTYENAGRSRVTDTTAFTFVDFAALDERYARHLACIPAERWDDTLIPVDEALAADSSREPDRVPCILMVDGADRLQKVLIDEKLLRDARRCREAWHSLQELGGIHNSHAQRLLAEQRVAQAQQASAPAAADETLLRADPDAATGPGPVADSVAEPPAEAPAEPDPDEAYIETARCTTCNECTQINDKMFSYNENRQAYIADPDAGTYAQLVEAAESCQVSIIHPGKPRNPDEPDLDQLLKRAEPFL